ncbi:MAG: acyl--CoA ligase [Verrucomicrobiae bacterium]|nr:acyl--CoA ligase [Verrucomicrobiae bacterium]
MTVLRPAELAELYDVFENLERGNSVALLPTTDSPELTDAPDASDAWLGLTSSGSTGRPKLQWRRWTEIKRGTVTKHEVMGWTWASPYRPWTFAGVQVAAQAWASNSTILSLGTNWAETWEVLRQRGVHAISATPTYMDLLLQEEPAPGIAWEPRQITLGGEPLRPATGDRLRRRFPNSNFTVIYAMAELGVLLKTHRVDGWYEVESIRHAADDWRTVDGGLEIMRGGRWYRTGDRVEVRDNLMRVIGRMDQVANVAGTKVSLIEVTELAEQVPGVRRATAVAEPSPVTGEIVCLRYAIEPGWDKEKVLGNLQSTLREKLRKEAWPRKWKEETVGPVQNAKRAVR